MNLMLERDTPEQCELFDQYLNHTEELEGRTRRGKGLSYDEAEWEAFQYGWNAALAHKASLKQPHPLSFLSPYLPHGNN